MSGPCIGMTLPPRNLTLAAAHIIGGAIASRDWQPQHHDHQRAQDMNLPGIILNTPSQMGLFCAFATAWSGPEGRVGRTALRMRKPLCPGDVLSLTGRVTDILEDMGGWNWLLLDLAIEREGASASNCRLWLAVPGEEGASPWYATEAQWNPPELVD